MMSIGAMVILVVLYTSSSLKTFGSLLLPPAIKKKPKCQHRQGQSASTYNFLFQIGIGV